MCWWKLVYSKGIASIQQPTAQSCPFRFLKSFPWQFINLSLSIAHNYFGPKGGRALLVSRPPGFWNLRAVWFHLSISELLLFYLVLLLILSSPCFCFWPSLLPTFQKCLNYFSRYKGLFVLPLFLVVVFHRLGDDNLVSYMCSMLPYGTGICKCMSLFLISWSLLMFF